MISGSTQQTLSKRASFFIALCLSIFSNGVKAVEILTCSIESNEYYIAELDQSKGDYETFLELYNKYSFFEESYRLKLVVEDSTLKYTNFDEVLISIDLSSDDVDDFLRYNQVYDNEMTAGDPGDDRVLHYFSVQLFNEQTMVSPHEYELMLGQASADADLVNLMELIDETYNSVLNLSIGANIAVERTFEIDVKYTAMCNPNTMPMGKVKELISLVL
ncbi:hypothetical protein [Vibrio sp. WXL103]|uniref:hypothetical protein n=1 Tax=Vibrio sp. WXL103 TaxID=3450710 RepID=UPI003EC913C7